MTAICAEVLRGSAHAADQPCLFGQFVGRPLTTRWAKVVLQSDTDERDTPSCNAMSFMVMPSARSTRAASRSASFPR